MTSYRAAHRQHNSFGSALLGVLILATIATLVLSYVLQTIGTGAQTAATHIHSDERIHTVDSDLERAVTWLRTNAPTLSVPFKQSQFYGTFNRTNPSVGSNDTITALQVPTRLKLQGGTQTAYLTSDNLIGPGAFPTINHGVTPFNPISSFRAALSGGALVRITLIDAIAISASGDFGDTDSGAQPPTTDFYPMWRVDAMSDITSGTRRFAYVVGSIASSNVGLYGQDYLTQERTCDAYRASNGPYGGTNRFARCEITSTGTLAVKNNVIVYGSAKTNAALSQSGGHRGSVCANFVSGCPVPGTTCEGPQCEIPGLPSAQSWASACPTNQGNLNVNKNMTLTLTANTPAARCWANVTVQNKRTLTLVTSGIPYYFGSLSVASQGSVVINPPNASSTIQLFVNQFANDRISDNEISNSGLPSQFDLNYWGSNSLRLTVNTTMSAYFYAPNAYVDMMGNGEYYGTFRAKGATIGGSGQFHYDETRPITQAGSLKFKMINLNEVLP